MTYLLAVHAADEVVGNFQAWTCAALHCRMHWIKPMPIQALERVRDDNSVETNVVDLDECNLGQEDADQVGCWVAMHCSSGEETEADAHVNAGTDPQTPIVVEVAVVGVINFWAT